jgi:hypothetical protein
MCRYDFVLVWCWTWFGVFCIVICVLFMSSGCGKIIVGVFVLNCGCCKRDSEVYVFLVLGEGGE